MSLKSDEQEIGEIVTRLLDTMLLSASSQTGRAGADLRRQIGRVRGEYLDLLSNGGFSLALLTCFRLAYDSAVKLGSLVHLRKQLFAEHPRGDIPVAIVQSAITFCLATESKLILGIAFVSRNDVEAMMRRMKVAFDTARDLAADALDSSTYQTLTMLAGALIHHLATVARPLPRMVSFKLSKNYPSLSASMKIYYEADRAEQLAAENRIVHPLFCLRELRGLNR